METKKVSYLKTRILIGLLIIVAGILLLLQRDLQQLVLLDNLGDINLLVELWPLLLILMGIEIIRLPQIIWNDEGVRNAKRN
jgi:hypothetical protein